MLNFTILTEDQWRSLDRFWRVASGFWAAPSARTGWGLTALLVVVVLLQLVMQYRINVWNRNFFDALERGQRRELVEQGLLFVPLAAGSTGFMMMMIWGRMTAQRKWRGWLTARLIEHWAASPHCRELTHVVGEHRNLEYRIAEDARIATELPIDFAIGLLSALLSAATFIGVLWTIGGTLAISAFGHFLVLPGYLVIAAIIYTIVVTTTMMIVGHRLVPAVEEKNQAESELRFAATRLREASEKGDYQFDSRPESGELSAALSRVLAAWRGLCGQVLRTTLVSQGNTLLAPVVGLLLCVPKYLVNALSLGEMVQAAAAFVIVQSAFNWLVDNYSRVADWLSSVNRVALLLCWLDGSVAAEIGGTPIAETGPGS